MIDYIKLKSKQKINRCNCILVPSTTSLTASFLNPR